MPERASTLGVCQNFEETRYSSSQELKANVTTEDHTGARGVECSAHVVSMLSYVGFWRYCSTKSKNQAWEH